MIISWVNRFYSLYIRYILYKKRKLLYNNIKNRISNTIYTINSIINNLYAPDDKFIYSCEQCVYIILASKYKSNSLFYQHWIIGLKRNYTIAKFNDKGFGWRLKFSILLAGKLYGNLFTLLKEITIFNLAAVINLI